MRFFFGIFMFVYLGASVFVILHTLDVLRPFRFRYILMSVYILLSFSLMLGRGFGEKLPIEISALLTRIGYIWISLLTFMFLWSLIWLVLRLLKVGPVSPKNRLIFFLAEVFLCLILFTIGYIQANRIQLVNLNVESSSDFQSPSSSPPLRIVQISDVHLGIMNGQKKFARIIEKIKQLDPDIVVITGDFLENEHSIAEIKEIGEPIKDLAPKYGIWAVNGNHEYISGIGNSINYMQSLGINVLRDEAVIIEDNILIIGREDRTIRRRSAEPPLPLKTLLEKEISISDSTATSISSLLKSNKYLSIILTHQAPNHREYESIGIDLVLSGHTHAGQFIPWSWVVKKQYDIAYGYEKRGNSHFYVSSGTAYWGPPFRLGTRSEIVLFEIRNWELGIKH